MTHSRCTIYVEDIAGTRALTNLFYHFSTFKCTSYSGGMPSPTLFTSPHLAWRQGWLIAFPGPGCCVTTRGCSRVMKDTIYFSSHRGWKYSPNPWLRYDQRVDLDLCLLLGRKIHLLPNSQATLNGDLYSLGNMSWRWSWLIYLMKVGPKVGYADNWKVWCVSSVITKKLGFVFLAPCYF